MYFNELKYFIDCIRYDKEPGISGEDAREALEIGLAVLKAAKTGREVSV